MIKRFRYWLRFVFVTPLVPIIPLGPPRLLDGLTSVLGWVVYHLDRRSRLVALANLEAAFGHQYTSKERERIARRSVQAFGRSFLELFWSPRLNRKNIERFVRFADEKRF